MGVARWASAAIASAMLFAGQAGAQPYPSRPITVIVPFAAGGPVDMDTRRDCAKLAEIIGQQVLIDYKPGAGTSIGAGYVAKAKPDGYTLLSSSSAFAVFPAFYPDPGFDPLKDLIPLSMMNALVSAMVVPASSTLKSFSEYLAYAKANPGKLNWGTSGVGDVSHLGAVWLNMAAGVKVTYVPFKGSGPMLIEVLAGRIDIASSSIVQVLPHIRAGKLRPLAVRSAYRIKPLPDVPAVNEHPGLKDYSSVNWLGFFAPAGTPPAVVDRLAGALAQVARAPDIVAELESQASTPIGNTPTEFRAMVIEEVARWKKLVAEAGIKP
jgi:tripartite-type tricarboxylate transporter receptor subunit TctC